MTTYVFCTCCDLQLWWHVMLTSAVTLMTRLTLTKTIRFTEQEEKKRANFIVLSADPDRFCWLKVWWIQSNKDDSSFFPWSRNVYLHRLQCPHKIQVSSQVEQANYVLVLIAMQHHHDRTDVIIFMLTSRSSPQFVVALEEEEDSTYTLQSESFDARSSASHLDVTQQSQRKRRQMTVRTCFAQGTTSDWEVYRAVYMYSAPLPLRLRLAPAFVGKSKLK